MKGALAIGLAFALPACGGSGTEPTPVTPTTSLVSQGTFSIGTFVTSGAICDPLRFINFSTSATGTLEAVTDWTFASSDIDIAIVSGQRCTCEDFETLSTEVVEQECPTVAEAIGLEKPERLMATNQPPGAYTLVVVNYADQVESCSYQVTLTTRR